MNRIRELRQEKELTQEELANLLFLKQQAIYSYENEKYEPDIDTLKKMAAFFGTSIDYIVGLVDIKTPINKVKSYELNELETSLIESFRQLPMNVQCDIYKVVDDISNL